MSTPTTAPPATDAADAHGHHDHPAHLAHHFDTEEQQFDSGKFGIWLFLVTEILFFSGLFCAYSIWRSEHPEIFLYSHYYLSTKWGAINTGVLLVSSLTAAWSVRCAQLGNQKGTVAMLALTILGACGFLGIKGIEYSGKIAHGTGPGRFYQPHPSHQIVTADAYSTLLGTAGALAEQELAEMDEAELAAIMEEGRQQLLEHRLEEFAADEDLAVAEIDDSIRNDLLSEIDADHEAHHSGFHGHEQAHGDGKHGDGEEGSHAAHSSFHGSDLEHEVLDIQSEHVLAQHEPEPRSVRQFFSIYFAMTGLHGIHVIAGIIALAWVMRRAMRGEFNPRYFGAVDYVALYWHLVDLIWIYLFPLLYLIN
ncbi:MAG: cytochrome c oxidase subunit 3 [Planctomycetota bacterium]